MKEYDTTYLRDIILNFVIAGKDTTAATLSWFMYMLCKYPAVQEKAAEEVREATNTITVSSCTEFVSCVTDEALEKMNYLHATLTETLRLYPAVPVVRLLLNLVRIKTHKISMLSSRFFLCRMQKFALLMTHYQMDIM